MKYRHATLGRTSLSHYLKALKTCEPLEREEEIVLARRYRETGDVEAAHKLVRSNLRAVVKIAVQYNQPDVGLAELVQEGNLGLLQAVERFDPDRKVRLVTYASWWIRAYIQRYLQRRYKAGRAMEALAREHGDDGAMRSSSRWARGGEISLDQTQWNMRQTLYDTVADDQPTQESEYLEREFSRNYQAWLAAALEELTPQERAVIERRYLAERVWTLKEIGEHLQLSRQRIYQIELRATRKLRTSLRQRGMELAA